MLFNFIILKNVHNTNLQEMSKIFNILRTDQSKKDNITFIKNDKNS